VDIFVNKWREVSVECQGNTLTPPPNTAIQSTSHRPSPPQMIAYALSTQNLKDYHTIKNNMSTLLEWRRQMYLAYDDVVLGKADMTQYTEVKNSILKLIEATKQQVSECVRVCVSGKRYLVSNPKPQPTPPNNRTNPSPFPEQSTASTPRSPFAQFRT